MNSDFAQMPLIANQLDPQFRLPEIYGVSRLVYIVPASFLPHPFACIPIPICPGLNAWRVPKRRHEWAP